MNKCIFSLYKNNTNDRIVAAIHLLYYTLVFGETPCILYRTNTKNFLDDYTEVTFSIKEENKQLKEVSINGIVDIHVRKNNIF